MCLVTVLKTMFPEITGTRGSVSEHLYDSIRIPKHPRITDSHQTTMQTRTIIYDSVKSHLNPGEQKKSPCGNHCTPWGLSKSPHRTEIRQWPTRQQLAQDRLLMSMFSPPLTWVTELLHLTLPSALHWLHPLTGLPNHPQVSQASLESQGSCPKTANSSWSRSFSSHFQLQHYCFNSTWKKMFQKI